jgi:hypothetical protein
VIRRRGVAHWTVGVSKAAGGALPGLARLRPSGNDRGTR